MSERNTDLMLRVQKGDERAFDALMRATYPLVLGIVHRYLGGRASAAEDLAQDVFLKIYRSRARYLPTARFTTWLYRITANLCLNYRRDAGRQRVLSLERDDARPEERRSPLADGEAAVPPDVLEKEEMARVVRAALDELPANQRLALVLARFEELSYEEISKAMGISEKAVKSLLHRARVSLKERVEARIGGERGS